MTFPWQICIVTTTSALVLGWQREVNQEFPELKHFDTDRRSCSQEKEDMTNVQTGSTHSYRLSWTEWDGVRFHACRQHSTALFST